MIFIKSFKLKSTKDRLSNDELFTLLKLAKSGNKSAKEKILLKYYGFIIFQAKGIYINAYTFEDLVQSGFESTLNSINIFDMDKPISAFNTYVCLAIKNNYSYLCRKEIRYNEVTSLNFNAQDDMESIDLVLSSENVESVVLNSIMINEMLSKFNILDREELDLIKFLYVDEITLHNQDSQISKIEHNLKSIENSSTKPHVTPKICSNNLSEYAKIINKSYYYCYVLKTRALKKLQNHYKDFL